jgi:riboflavin kinase / FMN adenylyltransferase
MLVTRGARCAVLAPVALTIGNFDGVHKGHQEILARTRNEAARRGLESCVLTFEPHPREYFETLRGRSGSGSPSSSAPTRLTSLREKLELLQEQGVDRVHVQRFHAEFAALAPEAFVHGVLERTLQTRWVLVGDDFCFGANRAGTTATLQQLSVQHGYELEIMEAIDLRGARVSSGAVREALACGNLEHAHFLLGRPYSISGRVVEGDKLGRQLGCPTANIQMKHNRPPLTGIFAVRVRGIGTGVLPGVASLGVRPTVKADGRAVLEVHVFDFSGVLYREHLRVDFLHKIRDEEKFADLDALRAQIGRDCEAARSYLRQV